MSGNIKVSSELVPFRKHSQKQPRKMCSDTTLADTIDFIISRSTNATLHNFSKDEDNNNNIRY
jgi:hypothetical protein